jgi:hypothetical protein
VDSGEDGGCHRGRPEGRDREHLTDQPAESLTSGIAPNDAPRVHETARGADGWGGPSPAPRVGTFVFASLALGASHSCGITTEPRLYCWGGNGSGQLGTSATANSSVTPEEVTLP